MNKKTQHILSTSSQLLGICFIVLTVLRIQRLFEASVIDELTAFAVVLFMTSSLLSFLSIRSENLNEDNFEKWADIIFLCALAIMLLVILLITFDLIS
jgi:tellurite resistance protein TehA-like permease